MGISDGNNTTGPNDETLVILKDSQGNEAKISNEGEVSVSNFANVDFQAANKTINTTESLASVGVSNLANRKSLIIFNRGAQDIFYGPTGVSDTTGIPILKDEVVSLTVGQNVNIYLITKTGNATVTIQEFS